MATCSRRVALAAVAAAVVSAATASGQLTGPNGWPSESPVWPRYPVGDRGRRVHVLNGTWEFAFLGDRPLERALPKTVSWEPVTVPDAFDARPDRPSCETCWPSQDAARENDTGHDGQQSVPPWWAGDGEASSCSSCCSRAFGDQGNRRCWNSEDPSSANGRSFAKCCGQDPLRYRRGVAAYRAEVELEPGTASLLLLGGCALRCLVTVDSSFIADHAGLSPFTVEVPASKLEGQRVRTVTILVDNRFDRRTHPVHQPGYDWYQAGGILRAVQLHSLPGPDLSYLAAVEVFPRSLEHVDVRVRPSLRAASRAELLYRWRFDDGDGCDSRGWAELVAVEGLLGVKVPGARPWSPAAPNLHRLKVAMLEPSGELLDCVEVRFGLRTVATRGRDILLNNEPVKLFGFNRHDLTDSPVLSHGDLVRDIMILKEIGANFVRGSHYAQDQRFLDLCDVHGLLVWEEVLGWQNTLEDFSDGVFMMQSLKLADEMAAASANHPSVIFFGFFNEGRSGDGSPATAGAYQAMASRLREKSAGTRLISWGSNAAIDDKHLAFADVCSFHDYPAWYPTNEPAQIQQVREIPLLWE
ncbi:unnamed protein product, partial [Polarella glacialis]